MFCLIYKTRANPAWRVTRTVVPRITRTQYLNKQESDLIDVCFRLVTVESAREVYGLTVWKADFV